LSDKISLKNFLDFRRRPFFILSIFFSLGIIAEFFTNLPFLPLFIIAFLLILTLIGFIFFKKDLFFDIFIVLFFFILGSLAYKNYNTLSPNHLYYQLPLKKTPAYCVGTIIEDPLTKKSPFSNSKTSFKINAEFLRLDKQWVAVEGKILVNLYGRKESFKYADRLLLKGDITRLEPSSNPGEFNYKRFLERNKIFALFKVSKGDLVKKIASRQLSLIKKGAFSLRHRLKSKIEQYISLPFSAILNGVLLGFRQDIPLKIEDLFMKTGTMHLLSISGLHVGLVIAVIIFFLKIVNLPRKLRFVLILLFLLFYVPLTGSRTPVIRASIMAAVVLIGFLFERETDIFNSLGIAALIILLFFPNQIFSIGFQLSFISLLAILYFVPKIEVFFDFGRESPNRLKFYLKKSVSVSLAAWIGTLPLIARYFNNFSLLTVISNLVAIPLSFLAIIFGIIFVFSPAGLLANLCANLTSFWISFLLKSLSLLSAIPFGFHRVGSWSISLIIVFYLVMIFIFNYRKFKIQLFYLLSGVLLISNLVIWFAVFRGSSGNMKVNFFDVGFSDAILIEFPKKGYMLIDSGSFARDAGRRIIAPYLWNKNIKRLDAVILTHPESDHAGGLEFILRNFEVGAVYDNGQTNESLLYNKYIKILEKNKIPHFTISEAKSIYGFEDVSVNVLHPPLKRLTHTSQDLNNNSIVLKLDYKDFSLFLTADVQAEGLRYLLGYKDILQADVLKLPHHGLESGTEMEILLEVAKPKVAIISAGEEKESKIRKIRQMLNKRNIEVYNTADSGFISIETDGISFEVDSYKSGIKTLSSKP
jgi:competence protein ComEC